MKKSRLYLIALVAFFVFSLASCDLLPEEEDEETEETKPGKVGIVLPAGSSRWVDYDGPGLKKRFNEANIECSVFYSSNTVSTELEKVAEAIAEDCAVLIIAPVNKDESEAAIAKAKAAGLKVVLYDRCMSGKTAADYYVSFDNYEIGEVQAKALTDSIGTETGYPLYIYTGAQWDMNSWLFFSGSWKYLQPKIADGTFVIKNSSKAIEYKNTAVLSNDQIKDIILETTTNWGDPETTALVEKNIHDFPPPAGKRIFILAPNDFTCRIIGDAFRGSAVTDMRITGQDGEIPSLQYILDGKQTMTIVKKIDMLCDTAVAFATKVVKGEDPGLTEVFNNGTVDIPFCDVPLKPVYNSADLRKLVEAGWFKESDFTWPAE